jgi:hypothetical protein
VAILTNAKPGVGAVYPSNAIEAELQRLEPILGPYQIRTRHLFGLDLVSKTRDSITKKPMVMTDEMIRDIIVGAISQAETECMIDISPVQRREKYPFDRQAYESYGYIKTLHRPISSIQKLSVTPANGQDVYSLPLDWVEAAYYHRGQINIIPMTAAYIQGGYVPSGTTGGVFFMSILGNRSWIPAYWQLEYITGFPDTAVPRIVNELVGTIAAQEILSQLAATNAGSNSHSLGIDGLSQSVSTPGPQIYKNRYDELQEKRDKLVKKIKSLYDRKIFSSHV